VLHKVSAQVYSEMNTSDSLSNPREGTQDRDDNEDVRDDTTSNDSRVLNSTISDDVDNLVE
jgi:hypothetical protein